MTRPEIFQQPTEERLIRIMEEELTWHGSGFDTDRAAKRIFSEIIEPLHRQWADQLRVEGNKR